MAKRQIDLELSFVKDVHVGMGTFNNDEMNALTIKKQVFYAHSSGPSSTMPLRSGNETVSL